MPEVSFFLQRKPGTTRDECLEYWAGERHDAIVAKLPRLTRGSPEIGAAVEEPKASR
jgi:hypothetical protein